MYVTRSLVSSLGDVTFTWPRIALPNTVAEDRVPSGRVMVCTTSCLPDAPRTTHHQARRRVHVAIPRKANQ